MKKLSKILVLVLAVALICTGLILAVSADTGTNDTASYTKGGETVTGDLATAISNADAGTTVKLEGDCKITQTASATVAYSAITFNATISKNLTIDLNGYNLHLPNEGFYINSAVTFTITGNGSITAEAALITSTATATVNVKGTGEGIKINHIATKYSSDNQNRGLLVYGTNAGTFNFENLDIVSNVFVDCRNGVAEGDENNQRAAMFRTDEGTAGTRWNFNRVSFYRDVAHDTGFQDAGAFVYIAGENAKATINNSVIKNSGPLINIAYMQDNKNPDHVFAEINNSHMEVILKQIPTRVSALTCRFRTSDREVMGTMTLTNSWFGGNVYRVFYGIDQELRVIADNSVIANLGANAVSGNNTDTIIMRAGTLTLKNGSSISSSLDKADGTSNALVMNGSILRGDKIGEDGNVVKDENGNNVKVYETQYAHLKLEVGTRFSSEILGKFVKNEWIDKDGNSVDSSKVKIILDPIGNYQYPYLSTTDENATSYNHLDASRIDMFGMEHGRGAGTGNVYGFMAESTGSAIDNNNTDFGAAFAGQAKNGAFTDVTYGRNTSFKYWISPIDSLKIGDERTTTLDSYLIFGDKDLLTGYANAVAPIESTKVVVYEMDIATDSDYGFPKTEFTTTSRADGTGTNNLSTEGYVNLCPDGSFENKNMQDFNADVKLSLHEWNHITVVVYTDKATPNPAKTGYGGQVYFYVNGELLGYYNGAYADAARVKYIQGFRMNIPSKIKYTVGQSILVDNYIRRIYSDYKVEGEADGAAKSPASYLLTDLPKNTSPTNNKIQVNRFDYATIDAAKAAVDAYNANSATTGIIEAIELNGNVISKPVIDDEVEITHNGYSLIADPASYGFIDDGEKFIFNEDYWYTASWYNGDPKDLDAIFDDANYVKETVKLGSALDREFYISEKEDNFTSFEVITQTGWSAIQVENESMTPLVPDLATLESAKENGETREIKYYPVISGIPMTAAVKNGTGYTKSALNDDETTALYKNLTDGETLVLLADLNLKLNGEYGVQFKNTSINTGVTIDNDYTEDEIETMKAASVKIAVDLNGHRFEVTDTAAPVAKVGTNTTLTFYSSKPGAYVYSGAYGTDDKGAPMVKGQRLFGIYNGEEKVAARKDVYNAHINVGTVTIDGVTYPGSNITLNGGIIVDGIAGDNSCSITLDGVLATRGIADSSAMILTRYYDGEITVKNSIFISPISGHFIDMRGYYKTQNTPSNGRVNGMENEFMTPYVLIDNTLFINTNTSATGGTGNMVDNNGDDIKQVNLEYTNLVTNARANSSNVGARNKIGVGVAALNLAADPTVPGLKKAYYYKPMTLNMKDTFAGGDDTHIIAIEAPYLDGTTVKRDRYVYVVDAGYENLVPEGATKVVLPRELTQITALEEDTVSVNWKTFDGSDARAPEIYCKGSSYKPITVKAPDHVLNAVKLVHGGTWEGIPAAGTVLTENVDIITKDFTPVQNIGELKANLSLYSDFLVNLYIPEKYAQYIVTVNGEALGTETVTLGDAKYYKVVVERAPNEASDNANFDFDIKEGEYEVTKRVSISIVQYAKTILAGESYSNADKILMYYMLGYVSKAERYFDKSEDAEIDGLLENETYKANYYSETLVDKTYGKALDNTGLGAAIPYAGITLNADPAFYLITDAGFAGTVTVTYGNGYSREFNVAAGASRTLTITGMKIYNFGCDFNIKVVGTLNGEAVNVENAKINLDTYAKYHTENAGDSNSETQESSEKALPVIKALYEYVKVAEMYKAGNLALPTAPETPAE